MSLYRRGSTWHFDFAVNGRRHRGTTGQSNRGAAERVLARLRTQAEQQAAGLPALRPADTPRFQDFAELYLRDAEKRLKRPDAVFWQLRTLLQFVGAKPAKPRPDRGAAPYHDLRLGDFIHDPTWILRFEEWLERRGYSGDHRNHLRTTLSNIYRLALEPAYRLRTGIVSNPIRDLRRDPPGRRTAVLGADELRRVLEHCSYHVRLALSIAALAPKLRRSNVLALEWARDVSPDWRYITVQEHKTAHHTGRPLVVPISDQLRRILVDARARDPKARHVVTYRGRRLRDVRDGLRAACEAAGVAYGRSTAAGVTFHSLRHTAATLLAEQDVSSERRQAAMGHASITTTMQYTHLRPEHERPAVEALSGALPIADLVTAPRRRASRGRVVAFASSTTP